MWRRCSTRTKHRHTECAYYFGTPMPLPRVLADLPVSSVVLELLGGRVELLPWDGARPRRGDLHLRPPHGRWRDDGPAFAAEGHQQLRGRGRSHRPEGRRRTRDSGREHPGHPRRGHRGPRVRADPRRRAPRGRGRPLRPRPELHAIRPVVHARPRGAFQHARHLRYGPDRAPGRDAREGLRHEDPLPQPQPQRRGRSRPEGPVRDEGRTARDRRLCRTHGAADARNARADRPGRTREDEAHRDPRERRPRRGGR